MNDLELHIKNSKINRFKAVKETLKGLISQDILNHILEPYMVEYPYIDIMLVSKGKIIEWKWVKGHSGNEYNEIVDYSAKMEAKNKK